jgi:hypothetical protein
MARLYELSGVEGEAMSVDIGTAAEVVTAGLSVLALWLGLRSQVRQGQIHARALADFVEALRTDENEGRQLHDGTGLGPPPTGGRDDQGEHG